MRINRREWKKPEGPRVNEEIRASQVRLVDENGSMIGIVPLAEALKIAREKGLDLLEVAPEANPPVCRILDYGKYKYMQKKKAAQAKKNQVVVEVKEIQLRPRTDVHDLEVKAKHARRFLLEGDKVKLTIRFSGRELAHQEVATQTVEKFMDYLKDIALIESQPQLDGRRMVCIIAPDAAKLKQLKKESAKAQSSEPAQNSKNQNPTEL